ncbi:DgyrCDS2373 [Dimorphilus gyrociliatus]|uniref:DgyrCDS2373 n=1 Tax=Dimorphilus gyrociliatus TaxID=2664684 RepID=A0A7I8VBE7_9ANNE|nr:DgyrCDS2373 [Dimorphilus gyrociliatus]
MARPDQGLAVARCNYVGQDDIWKSHVYHETKAAKSWPRNWNFMTTRYRDLVKEEFPVKEKAHQETKLPKITPIEERVKVCSIYYTMIHTTLSLFTFSYS